MAGGRIDMSSKKEHSGGNENVENRRFFKIIQSQYPNAAPLRQNQPAETG